MRAFREALDVAPPEFHVWHHKNFQRGRPDLLPGIKTQGTGGKDKMILEGSELDKLHHRHLQGLQSDVVAAQAALMAEQRRTIEEQAIRLDALADALRESAVARASLEAELAEALGTNKRARDQCGQQGQSQGQGVGDHELLRTTDYKTKRLRHLGPPPGSSPALLSFAMSDGSSDFDGDEVFDSLLNSIVGSMDDPLTLERTGSMPPIVTSGLDLGAPPPVSSLALV